MQKSKVAVREGLANRSEKKRGEKQRRKGRYKRLNAEFHRIAEEIRKPSSAINAKK